MHGSRATTSAHLPASAQLLGLANARLLAGLARLVRPGGQGTCEGFRPAGVHGSRRDASSIWTGPDCSGSRARSGGRAAVAGPRRVGPVAYASAALGHCRTLASTIPACSGASGSGTRRRPLGLTLAASWAHNTRLNVRINHSPVSSRAAASRNSTRWDIAAWVPFDGLMESDGGSEDVWHGVWRLEVRGWRG